MIFGIGCDIADVSRFEKWVSDSNMYGRFFNPNEFPSDSMRVQRKCEHFASRFAATEAFSKALGTGVRDFSLDEVWVRNTELGKPELVVEGKALEILEKMCGKDACVHVSLSHEKKYAVACVIIEVR